ncbi:uncharacterized protein LOC128092424 [Culex pipiens pallens]|uniref:uncharacterized protein LOC128092424 n=1 Tax=Culex pipiens pallens TaxID=42434 RepID=UPI0022AB32B9|nr:uncharacterized protein LOC128092424 [Culex pipiens pallens]
MVIRSTLSLRNADLSGGAGFLQNLRFMVNACYETMKHCVNKWQTRRQTSTQWKQKTTGKYSSYSFLLNGMELMSTFTLKGHGAEKVSRVVVFLYGKPRSLRRPVAGWAKSPVRDTGMIPTPLMTVTTAEYKERGRRRFTQFDRYTKVE